jgi:formylglycine-generating enzyme required for sulfatase activity
MRESENTIGDERLALAKAKVLAQEFEAEQRGANRRAIVVRLVELTAMLPTDPGLRMQMLTLRGRAALELNDSELGWSTAKELRALNASATVDDAGLEVLGRLDLKGWNTDERPTWYEVVAREVDAAIVTDPDGRARMAATTLPWKVRDKSTGIVMLLCPPGEFMMGSPASEAGRDGDEAQQRVSIRRAFYISETQVTQAQWERAMGKKPADSAGVWEIANWFRRRIVAANPSHFKGAENPVEQVSWNRCQRFCSATDLRLPSEAEWEYACRAGTTGAYAGDLDAMAWYRNNSGGSTHPVKQKRANAWGLYDMHGNVWEWCEDGYEAKPVGTQEAAGASSDRVLRGGSWDDDANLVRSSNRIDGSPGGADHGVGFRVARAPL